MDARDLSEILHAVAAGRVPPAQAAARIGGATADLGFARVDRHRGLRTGFPEVVYGPGKSPEEVAGILASILEDGERALLTRIDEAQLQAARRVAPDLVYHARARLAAVDRRPRAPEGLVAVLAAGTSDLAVAEEAARTAEALGARVAMVADVGVAGLHRLAPWVDTLRAARAVVVAAGMEGALPSVVAGLVAVPVIALPTSTGYGASFGGVAALLAMLNSCAAGVTVVNIDNGFGAGFAAALVNRRGGTAEEG
jgi:NCAIR mutase (PurE)-related protein